MSRPCPKSSVKAAFAAQLPVFKAKCNAVSARHTVKGARSWYLSARLRNHAGCLAAQFLERSRDVDARLQRQMVGRHLRQRGVVHFEPGDQSRRADDAVERNDRK